MAKGARGNKNISVVGGGGGVQAPKRSKLDEANNNPMTKDRDNIALVARTKDGERKDVVVSIQNTSQLDNIENLDYARGEGRFRDTNIYRALAADAERNALKPKENQIFMKEPEAKEGKWTKTDSVPVVRKVEGARVLEKTSGYVTKIDGETVYAQRRGRGEWAINYKGMIASPPNAKLTSLDKVKNNTSSLMNVIKNNPRSKKSAEAQFRVLNNNLGRISDRVYKEISIEGIADRL